tara:strand:- start:1560 stop:1814 length:255 start_codon:yes stop_codon:yes gene_type:complete
MAKKGGKTAKSTKKKLSPAQEFEIMKLVFDKFLWIGFGFMALGLWRVIQKNTVEGISWLVVGAVVLFIFTWLTVKEYEIVESKS